MFCPIRVEQFAREEVDLKLGASLDFDVPTTDLSDVRQMMDSMNVLPGQTPPVGCCSFIFTFTGFPSTYFYAIVMLDKNKTQIKRLKCALKHTLT